MITLDRLTAGLMGLALGIWLQTATGWLLGAPAPTPAAAAQVEVAEPRQSDEEVTKEVAALEKRAIADAEEHKAYVVKFTAECQQRQGQVIVATDGKSRAGRLYTVACALPAGVSP